MVLVSLISNCNSCIKPVKKNQAQVSCCKCDGVYHLKCIGVEFESSRTCHLCSQPLLTQPNQVNKNIDSWCSDLILNFRDVVRMRGLKCLHQTIRSLIKIMDDIRLIIPNLKSGIQVFAITEIRLTKTMSDDEISIPCYTLFRKDRGSKGGGIVLYRRDDLAVIHRSDPEHHDIESLWLKITLPNSRGISLVTRYRPPNFLH